MHDIDRTITLLTGSFPIGFFSNGHFSACRERYGIRLETSRIFGRCRRF